MTRERDDLGLSEEAVRYLDDGGGRPREGDRSEKMRRGKWSSERPSAPF